VLKKLHLYHRHHHHSHRRFKSSDDGKE
jgi:hypothetical protein